jgi:hypothetical protein
MIAGSFSVNLGADAFWCAVILSSKLPLFAGLQVCVFSFAGRECVTNA